MDIISAESFVAILRHLSEQDRIKMLCTCKKMREWLHKRQDIARAAFDAFKAKCLKDGWRRQDDRTVRLNTTENHDDRTVDWSETVCLQENGLISIRSTERVIIHPRMVLPSLDTIRFFTPWFRVTTTPGRYPRTKRTNDIRKMLLNASPRLV